VDISPEQTWRASRRAKEAGLDDVLSFHTAGARQALPEADGQYDVVLALNSLHHFGHLGETMRLIARALGPGGLLIMDEYVGPSRFQWPGAQIRAANTLLAALPEERRLRRPAPANAGSGRWQPASRGQRRRFAARELPGGPERG
jgi:SAM-dependent methyltransferase